MEQIVKNQRKLVKGPQALASWGSFHWGSVVPSAITTSLGGAVLGGSIANVPGAIVGGVFGTAVAIWSELRPKKKKHVRN